MSEVRRVGEYEILAELSEGGMGEVLLARRRGAHGFEKLVALKTIKAALRDRDDYRTMFLDEARLVARLHHPAIAQVNDFGDTDGQLFLAMEYVGGLSFDQLNERGRLPPGVVARAMAEICRGLHAAHEATDLHGQALGVVHRDVSPQNLVLTFDGRAKILDFGIARAEQRETPETQLGLVKGKPAYMSPEQLLGRRVDRRSDVFAVGVVLHEMLTGEGLFRAPSMLEIADRVRNMPIPPPSARVADLPSGLDEVVLGALERDLDERTPDVETIAIALERIAQEVNAESLEAFARRELAEAREEHAEFLRTASVGHEAGPRRADQPTLADDREQPTTRVDGRASSGDQTATATVDLAPPGVVTAASGADSTEHALAAAGLGRRRWPLVVGLLLVGGLAAGAVGFWRAQQESLEAAALVPEAAAVVAPTVAAEEQGPVIAPVEPDAEPDVEPETAPEPAKKRKSNRRRRKQPRAKAKVSEEAAPAPTTFGFVKVTSDPFYANVRIDGRAVGPTPLVRHRLPVGRHVVEIIKPDTGAVIHRQEVVIAEGGLVRVAAPR